MRRLEAGDLGRLQRIEVHVHANLLDMGTHLIDMAFMLNRECPARWVMGQVDTREVKRWFGVPFEWAAAASIGFDNDVHAAVRSGGVTDPAMKLGLRLTCERGTMECPAWFTKLRVLRRGAAEWEEEGQDDPEYRTTMRGAVDDIVAGLEGSRVPQLCAENALRATEVVFATFESSRRRARVDLPLDAEDSSLQLLLDGREHGQRTDP
jgi:predicted dehydrogenase